MARDMFEALGAKKPEAPASSAGETDQGTSPGPDEAGQKAADNNADNNGQTLDNQTEGGAAAEGKEQEQNPNPAGSGENQDKSEMSKEERARNAARRREDERKAEIDRVRAEERQAATVEFQRQLDQSIADMRIVNPATNKLITNKVEYDAYTKEKNDEIIKQNLERAGIDREAIDAIIDNHPAVLEAKKLGAEAEKEKLRAQEMTADERAKEQLEIVQKLDPNIKTIEDIRAMENFNEVYSLVRDNGLSISQAFRIVNAEAIEKRRVDAALQQAINTQRGKEHLTAEGANSGAGDGGVTVPKAVADNYRSLEPGITQAQIQKKYEAYLACIKKG